MTPKKPVESQAQIQNRLRAEAENTRAIQSQVSTRSNDFSRRFRPRKSIVTGAVTRSLS